MKKFFAMVMAAAMIATMSAVSFAAYSYSVPGGIATGYDGAPTHKDDKDGQFSPVVNAIGPFAYDNEDKMLVDSGVEYGETAYFALLQANFDLNGVDGLVKESEVVSNLKVKPKWEEGSNMVKSVSIVKKKVMNPKGTAVDTTTNKDEKYLGMQTLLQGDYNYQKDEYYYFIAITTQSSTSVSDTDVIGTLTLSKSKDPKVDDLDMDVNLNLDWENSYRKSSDYVVDGDTDDLKDDTYYSLKFDYDDEVDINFEDGSIFTVDVSGQSKLLLYYDTEFNAKIAAKYPLAELNFWNGNGAKFNRVGEMFIACKEDYSQFLYQVNADGTLSEVPGAEFDKYDEGFYFNTRVLGTYVISDMELELPSTTPTTPAVETPVVTTPVVTNPSTGAAA